MVHFEHKKDGPVLVGSDGRKHTPRPISRAEGDLPPLGFVFRDSHGKVFRVKAVRPAVNHELVYPRRLEPPRNVMTMWFPSGTSERDHAIVEPYEPAPGEPVTDLRS